jgi:transposase
MNRVCLGVDIAKATFAAALWEAGRGRSLGEFANTPAGFEQLRQRVCQALPAGPAASVHLTLEPTGGYELGLAGFALAQGWRVSLPNPRHVRDFAKGLGQRAKTDKQDALLLARYGAERQPPPWAPLPLAVSALESLLQRRGELEQMLRQERSRQQGLAARPGVAPRVLPNVEQVIEALETALEQVEAAVQEHLQQQPELAEQARQLRAVPGVGAQSVLPLLVLLHRWHALTGGAGTAKKLTAYAGLDPLTHQSGTSVRGRETISRMGDRQMRARLYMCALGGVKGKNALREYYQRLVGRGKAKKVALVAASRKILIWAWAVFRDHVSFQAEKALPQAA